MAAKGDAVPLAVDQWYDFHEFGCHLGNVGRNDDPVIFFEHKAMYDMEMDVPDEPYAIAFGEANVTREGDDVTIIAFGHMVNLASDARKPASGRPWGQLATRTTMRCARASLPPSNASCSTGGSSRPRPQHAWPSSSSSRAGTIPADAIRPSVTNHPSTMKGAHKIG